MVRQNTTDNTTWALAFLLIALALVVQFAGFMNLDNAWLLHVAERVVNGEKLGKQVVESNPPLIVYMMEVPVYLARAININPIHAFIGCIGAVSIISLMMSFSQFSGHMAKISMTFAVMFLPSWAFGEREHLFIMLTLPYFVSLWRKDKPGIVFLVVSGLMAGFGFSLKPFFLLTWATMVLTKMVLDRRFWSWFSLQNIIIGTVIAAYVAYLILVEKTYVNEVFPLLFKYYGSYNSSASQVYKQSLELVFLCQIAFWVIYLKDRKILTREIYFCSFASLISAVLIIIQGKVWMNYFYPPNFFGFMSNVLITVVLFDNLKPLWNKVASFVSSFILMVFVTLAISICMKIAFNVKEEETTQMVEIMDKYASGKLVYALTFDLGTIYPALLYSHADYKGHYGHLWMIPGMYEGQPKKGDELVFRGEGEKIDDETKAIAVVVSDLAHNPPELIFVVNSKYYSRKIGDYKFDFVKYFSTEPAFVEIWSHYKKIARVGNKDVYLYQHGKGVDRGS